MSIICPRCGKDVENEWHSKSGYCKECAQTIYDEQRSPSKQKCNTCCMCGSENGLIDLSIDPDGRRRRVCRSCRKAIDDAAKFKETRNIILIEARNKIMEVIYRADTDDVLREFLISMAFEGRDAFESEQRNLSFDASKNGGFWEYMTLCISDKFVGTPNAPDINIILNRYGRAGWKLKSVTTNESGKSGLQTRVGGIGVGVNATADTTVLIFERFVNAK